MDQPGQEVMLAEARVSPVKYPQHLTYVLARRTGADAGGRFVSPRRDDASRRPVGAVAAPAGLRGLLAQAGSAMHAAWRAG